MRGTRYGQELRGTLDDALFALAKAQIGAPLVSDMLSMNVLRPFSAREVAALGGEGAFHPAAWQISQ